MNKKTLNRLGIILIILLGIASIYLIITSHLNSDDSNSSFQNLVPMSYDETNTSYTTDYSIIEDGLNDMGFLITQAPACRNYHLFNSPLYCADYKFSF